MARAERLWLAAALAVYAAIELALLWRFPIFFDEALFASEAQLLVDHVTWANASIAVADNHGVLQRWLTAGGIWIGLPSLTTIRLISIVSGAVTVVAVAALARRIDARAYAPAAMTAALMPALVVHSAVGIADPLAVAATTVAGVLIVRLGEAPTWRDAAACALAIAVAVLTKKTGLLAVGLVVVGGVIAIRHRPPVRKWLAASGIAVAAGLAAWAVLEFLTPADLRRIGAYYRDVQYAPLGEAVRALPSHFADGVSSFGGVAIEYATLPLIVLAGYGLVRCARRRPDVAVLLVVWMAVPFGLAVTAAQNPYPRYILPLFPPVAALAGVGVAGLGGALARVTSLRLAAPALAVAAFIPAVVLDVRVAADPHHVRYPGEDDVQYVSGFGAGTPWPRLARALEQRAGSRPVVTVGWGGRGTGPIGLAAELGRPRLEQGTINAGYFDAQNAGRVFRFVPHRDAPDAPFLVAQDANVNPPPPEIRREYQPIVVEPRPHGGLSVALLQRRP